MLKNTTQALHSKPTELKAYEPDESICPVRTVRPGAIDRLSYLIFIKIFNHIV